LEPVAIVTRLVFSVPLTCLHVSADIAPIFPVQQAALFFATHFLGHCFGLIPASCSFAYSAFLVPIFLSINLARSRAAKSSPKQHGLMK
jgi:hypothetical protein